MWAQDKEKQSWFDCIVAIKTSPEELVVIAAMSEQCLMSLCRNMNVYIVNVDYIKDCTVDLFEDFLYWRSDIRIFKERGFFWNLKVEVQDIEIKSALLTKEKNMQI